jgi:OmpA-OmpF porin, OOP family
MNKKLLSRTVMAGLLVVPLAIPLASSAQTRDDTYSWLPFTNQGYFGAAAGQSTFDLNCSPGFSCDDKDSAFKIYTGGRFRNVLGLELGYVDLGKVDFGIGTAKARGVNLSLTANLPLNEAFSIYGKVGSTYGSTEAPVFLEGNKRERGFGKSYGAGLEFSLGRNWAIRGEWERQTFEFANAGDRDVDLGTVGVHYKF